MAFHSPPKKYLIKYLSFVNIFCFFKVLDDFFENNLTSNAFISEPTSKSKDLYPDAKKLISSLNHFTG